MAMKKSILGAGLSCVDIIYHEGQRYLSNGGSCANVMSILSLLGWDATILKAKYSDDFDSFLNSNFNRLNVNVINYKKVKRNTPRVIEDLNNSKHHFFTQCPTCDKALLKLEHIDEKTVPVLDFNFDGLDVFYYDRVSKGIKMIVASILKPETIAFYEPNTGRNPNLVVSDSCNADIVKFSKNKISMGIAERIRDLAPSHNVKIIIVTDGSQGLKYCHKRADSSMTEWYTLPPFSSKNIIDTSGAGDWLTAGFLKEFIKIDSFKTDAPWFSDENSIELALEKGLEYSSLCCENIGAQGAFYSETQMMKLRNICGKSGETSFTVLDREIFNNQYDCEVCLSD